MKRTLGVCYYPEHWPREVWQDDAKRMASMGLTWVRIGEFAWGQLEKEEGKYDFSWLDDAIGILGREGLKIVLGTPTATPPRWMINKYPDMTAVDRNGQPRKFGSRRHYCFSHQGYREECRKIVAKIAERYGSNPHVSAWQTDNEYGCHDTTISYSGYARQEFRIWLKTRYGSIERLNEAWGNHFWSMAYSCFSEVDLPNLTVTEANPAHELAFRRFSSDQVVSFNAAQTEIIRRYSSAPITHNFMGRITDFDHFQVGKDLDFACWDSYPLGFLEDRISASETYKADFSNQGDCDFQAFHHDLYRSVGNGRWWVMEQQPGPVNWAPYNPSPLPGMVKLWSWEAFAHGAEVVSYFRWRQLPFAQEQLHSGLLRPDGEETEAVAEIASVIAELEMADQVQPAQAEVAIIFDYDSDYSWVTQPHGKGLNYFQLIFETYQTLRSLGLSIDFLPSDTEHMSTYKVVFVPGLVHMGDDLKQALFKSNAICVVGPRSAARIGDMEIPRPLPPDLIDFDCVVSKLESLRPNAPIALESGGYVTRYREWLETNEPILEKTVDGVPVLVGKDQIMYLAAMLDDETRKRLFKSILDRTDVDTIELPQGVRVRDTATERFWFNYNWTKQHIAGFTLDAASYKRELR